MTQHQHDDRAGIIEKHAQRLQHRIKAEADDASGSGCYTPSMGILRDAMARVVRDARGGRVTHDSGD